MPQNRDSGDLGRRFGHECASRTAEYLGATKVAGRSNVCVWKGKRVIIKSAKGKNRRIGVLTHMVPEVDLVVGVFQIHSQRFGIWSMAAPEFLLHSKPHHPKRSGPQRMMRRADFCTLGNEVATVTFSPPLETIIEAESRQ